MTKKKRPGSIVKAGGIAKERAAEKARDEEFRRAEVSGDGIASRHDAAKVHMPNRGK